MKTTVLFDMDGVISDTQDMQAEIESQLLKRFGILIPGKEITKRYAGVKTSEFFKDLLDKKKAVYDIDKLMDEKRKKVITNVKKELNEIPDSVELIKKLHKDGYKLAVASASNRKLVEIILKKLKIKKYFLAVITGDDVKKGKPNPESYLLAARSVHSKPSECIVIEDGVNGMQSGKNAKMFVIGLVPKNSKLEYPADLLVNTHKQTMSLDFKEL